ncbi:IPTL-CTERM sorting domain-containing protein [Pseudorhodoferax sp.]|uniref:IPTL-CTERM sorting domain-containing protein n=1 Tax=Pseudorhodoferax sp. TaxID=1993553 RepID=UPI002DD6A522|nr:IPTL-CTERM sorting domain-containing protein [Pseudorhodoferax sp.]
MRKTATSLAVALALLAPGWSMAAPLTGTVAWTGHPVYSQISTDLRDGANQLYSDLPVLLICLDHGTNMPADGPTSFFSAAGASAIRGPAGAAGVAAVHWLIDQHYLTYYKNGSGQQQRAFQYALWEIGNDYNGSAASIDINLGSSRPATADVVYPGDPAFIAAYTALYQAMVAALPSLPVTYRSQTYTLDLFNNQDPTLQSMVALVERAPVVATPTVTPVPTLGQWALVLLSGLVAACAFRGLRRTPTA